MEAARVLLACPTDVEGLARLSIPFSVSFLRHPRPPPGLSYSEFVPRDTPREGRGGRKTQGVITGLSCPRFGCTSFRRSSPRGKMRGDESSSRRGQMLSVSLSATLNDYWPKGGIERGLALLISVLATHSTVPYFRRSHS